VENLQLPDGGGDAAPHPSSNAAASRGRGIVARAITGNSSPSSDAGAAGAAVFTASNAGTAVSPANAAAASSSPAEDDDAGITMANDR